MTTGLPGFVIVGAPRCATTSVAMYLSEHPEVSIAPQKEVHFFDLRHDRGVDWYQAQFDPRPGERLIGDASPNYMYSEDGMRRMADLLPNAKIVVLLREPVARAYSGYWFRSALMRDPRTFEETIADEQRPGYVSKDWRPGLLAGSTYLPALERICRFYPREALHVMLVEDLRLRAEEEFASLCRFLGIDDAVRPPSVGRQVNRPARLRSLGLYRVMVKTRAWRRLPFRLGFKLDEWNHEEFSYPPIEPSTEARLREYFAPHNSALARWLGRDLSEWEAA